MRATPARCNFLKPAASIDNVYVLGGKVGKTKRPSLSVVVVWEKLFVSSTTLTEAPGTEACCASLTVPAIEPLVVWAILGSAVKREKTIASLQMGPLIDTPPLFVGENLLGLYLSEIDALVPA